MKAILLRYYVAFLAILLLPLFLTAQVLPTVDMKGTKVSSSPGYPGTDITYLLTMKNNSVNTAINAKFTDALPTGTTFVSLTGADLVGATVTTPAVGANGTVTILKPTLAAGASATFTLVIHNASVAVGGSIVNTALLGTDNPEANFGDNHGVSVIQVNNPPPLPTVDMIGTKTSSGTGFPGTDIIYTLTMRNSSTNTAINAKFTDALPAGITFVSLSGADLVGATVTTPAVGSNGTVIITKPTLAPGASATFTLVAHNTGVAVGGSIVNIALLGTDNPEANFGNNHGVSVIQVNNPPPLPTVDMKGTKASFSPGYLGTDIIYTLTMTNNSGNTAINPKFTDNLPAGITFVSLAGADLIGATVTTPAVGTNGTVTISKSTLAPGTSATFTLVVHNTSVLPGTNIVNIALLSTDNPELNFGDNHGVSVINVTVQPCTLTCPGNIEVSNTIGQCGAIVNYSVPGTTGSCGTVTASPASGSFFPVGTTTVNVSSTSGQSCSFTVKVNDAQAPSITSCPTVSPFCKNSSNTYTVPALTATDNCSGTPTVSYAITGVTTRSGTGNNASGMFNQGVSTINWTVKDVAGNTATCQTTVTVNANPTAAIPDAFSLPSGVAANTVYIGYAPASSITLTAGGSGGTPPYHYSWSNGRTTQSITVNPTVTTTYTVTVTDASGCSGTASKTINVVDVRCGNKLDKVQVCQVPPGNPGNAHGICVSANAVPAHLAEGSYLGACYSGAVTFNDKTNRNDLELEAISNGLTVQALSNPAPAYFTLTTKSNSSQPLQIKVFNALGSLVEVRTNIGLNTTLQIGQSYRPGMYYAEVVQGKQRVILKLVKENK